MSIRVIKSLKIDLDGKDIIRKDLDVNSSLTDTRKKLSELIPFPFVFVDDEDNEINKELENNKNLCDILDGKNLIIKKEVKMRKILGKKINSKDKLDYYLYPQFKLTADQEDCSTNILVIGETGVGKSTWIHALLNYIQGIQIEENVRYKIFDQTELRKRYEKKYGKQFGEKQAGSSDTDEPNIYNIIPNDEYSPYENPIRIIDTAGFGDTRGKEYDEKISDDIRKMFESSNIESLNAVCLIFKGTETRSHERTKDIFDKLFSLFGKDIRNNIIIIFTFANSSTDAMTAITTLKDKSSPFYQIMGDIEQMPHFFFNNIAYFSDERENYYNAFEQNTLSFSKFFNYIIKLNRVSLENTIKILSLRSYIRKNIDYLFHKLDLIKNEINKKYTLSFFRKYIIYDELMSCINILCEIVLQNNELNLLALKKDKTKYDYSQRILMENISKKKEKNAIYDFIQTSLMDIENICSSKIKKDMIIRNFMRKSLNNTFY